MLGRYTQLYEEITHSNVPIRQDFSQEAIRKLAGWLAGLFKSSFAPLRHCPFTFICHISWSLVHVVVKVPA